MPRRLLFSLPLELRFPPRKKVKPARSCEGKNAALFLANVEGWFRGFPRNAESRIARFNEPPFAESMTARRSNGANSADRACTDPSFRRFFPSRFFPNLFIYLFTSGKKNRFDSHRIHQCTGKAVIIWRNAEKAACFPRLDSLPPRDRSGRQVRRIENVNSNRSEPLGSLFLDGVPLYPSSCRSKSYTRSW